MDDVATTVFTRHKLDVDDFYRMAEAGIFRGRDRVELIDGELFDMAPIGDDHVNMVNVLNEVLVLACQGRATVSVQNPVRLSRDDLPQPDFAIYRQPLTFYQPGERARRADVLLLIEVADMSLSYDRSVKVELYAKFDIPEYWIVDVQNRTVIVHRKPSGAGFAEVLTLTTGTQPFRSMRPRTSFSISGAF